MPPQPPKGPSPKKAPPTQKAPPAREPDPPAVSRRTTAAAANRPRLGPLPTAAGDMPLGVAVSASGDGGTVTARRAGGLRDLGLDVNPKTAGVAAALQHLAKAVNIAFQSDFGENELESVYQAAIVRRGELQIVHREYFGFGDNWFGQFGRFLRSVGLTLKGTDPASPEGQRRIAEQGPSTIRGLLNVVARKADLVTEYEDRVPAYVEQMFDRLEGSGIIDGWNRDDWTIYTTTIGLDIRVAPKTDEDRAAGR